MAPETNAADPNGPGSTGADEMTFAEQREDQLTRAPKSGPEDAAPRITLSKGAKGRTRIDVAETAVVRPGNPDRQNADGLD